MMMRRLGVLAFALLLALSPAVAAQAQVTPAPVGSAPAPAAPAAGVGVAPGVDPGVPLPRIGPNSDGLVGTGQNGGTNIYTKTVGWLLYIAFWGCLIGGLVGLVQKQGSISTSHTGGVMEGNRKVIGAIFCAGLAGALYTILSFTWHTGWSITP